MRSEVGASWFRKFGEPGGKQIEGLAELRGVSSEQMEFAEFFHASWEPCLRAVVAVVGSQQLAEDQVAEAFARAWVSWRKVSRHPALGHGWSVLPSTRGRLGGIGGPRTAPGRSRRYGSQ